MEGATSECPAIWELHTDATDGRHYDTRVMQKHPDTLITNVDEFAEQSYLLAQRYGVRKSGYHPFQPDMPTLVLNYPSRNGFLPDFFSSTGRLLCSAYLREAMALPPGVAQYLPLDVHSPDPRVHVMDYKVLRVLAHQATVDLAHSDVDVEEETDRHIGGAYNHVTFYRRLALCAGLVPNTDLFHADELGVTMFATDSLAERVMRAGCWGVEFCHPEEPFFFDRPRTIRTARGIEKAGPKARRAHLRLVKRVRARQGLPPP